MFLTELLVSISAYADEFHHNLAVCKGTLHKRNLNISIDKSHIMLIGKDYENTIVKIDGRTNPLNNT